MRFESQTLNGIRLGWRIWGSTENYPLLCLHGAWGQSEFWAPFANSISEQRCVVALDLRGHGESGWSEDYSLSAFSADVAALRAYYGWRPSIWWGYLSTVSCRSLRRSKAQQSTDYR